MRYAYIAAGAVAAYLFRREIMGFFMNEQAALQNPNVQAFKKMVQRFESGGDYSILYGGGHFSDFSAHPRVKVPFFNPKTQKSDYSTAAGAYQINYPTWVTIQALGALPDFSPASQDIAFVRLLKMCGALDFIVAGDFQTGLTKASIKWASLPGSTSLQHQASYDTALRAYKAAGGVVAVA